MTCPSNRTRALGIGADSVASGNPAFDARSGLDAVTGMRTGRPKFAGWVDVVGDVYRLVETTPTA